MKKMLLIAVIVSTIILPLQAWIGHWHWTSDINISNSSQYGDQGPLPGEHMIAVPKFNPEIKHVVFSQYVGDHYELCYVKGDGENWGTPVIFQQDLVKLSKEGQFSIACDPTGQYIYIVYHDETYHPHCQINLIRSLDWGYTWENPVRVSPNLNSYYYQADITAGNEGKVYIIWQQGWRYEPHKIGFARSDDYGVTWNVTEQIDTCSIGRTIKILPSITCDLNDSYVHAVWSQSLSDKKIIYRRYNVNSGTWGDIKIIASNNTISTKYPHIECSKYETTDKVYIVWSDNSYNPETYTEDVYFVRSFDNGISWSNPVILSSNVSNNISSRFPVISASQRNNSQIVDLVYEEINIDNNSKNIYWRRSNNCGISWGPITQLSNSSDSNYNGFIATDNSDFAHVVFSSNRGGGYDDIYSESYISGLKPREIITSNVNNTYVYTAFAHSNNEILIPYNLKSKDKMPVDLKIYNVNGRLIRNLNIENKVAIWDRKNDSGRKIQQGVYFYKIKYKTGNIERGKIVLIE